MAEKKIFEVPAVAQISGGYKVPCGIGDNDAHTVLVSELLRYTKENINLSYTDIRNTPSLANVAISGSYSDLQNKPTKLSQFSNDKGFTTLTEVSMTFRQKLEIQDSHQLIEPYIAKENVFVRVSEIQTNDVEFVDCNCQEESFLELAFGDRLPNIVFPQGVFVSGAIDEPRHLYQLRFLSNTIIINKFEQI